MDHGGARLAGKTAIITGGARGQGEAEVRRFVAEGANVVIGDLLDEQGEKLAAELGQTATYLHMDVTQESDWAKAVATAEAYGPLNVLVNNAAIHWFRPIEHETVDGFEKMWRVNALGPFLGMKAVLEPMRRAGGGSIVNISSTAGITGYAYHGAYAHTKWALRGLTKVAAVEFGEAGIRVNSVHPGPIKTTMLPDYENPEVDERFRRLPAGRAGDPSEVAALVLFLASDESRFITGIEHIIDGGSTAGVAIPYKWDEATMGPKGS